MFVHRLLLALSLLAIVSVRAQEAHLEQGEAASIQPSKPQGKPMKLKNYESEHTRFMRELLQSNPQLAEKQQRYRATWWDRPQDLRERRAQDEAKVAHEAYAYYHNP